MPMRPLRTLLSLAPAWGRAMLWGLAEAVALQRAHGRRQRQRHEGAITAQDTGQAHSAAR